MSRSSRSLAPLLLPFGGERSASSPSTSELPERPLGAAPVLAALVRTGTSEAHYDLAHTDEDGRLAVRTAAGTLGWSDETILLAAPCGLSIVVAPSPAGNLKLGTGTRLRLPIALRRRAGLIGGAPALLVTDAARGELIIYSVAALDAMIASWRAVGAGGAK